MLLKRFFLTSILILFISNYLVGQNHTNFTRITPKLDNRIINVTHTVQDSLGFIWMGYISGILKYDGYNFSSIPHENIFGKNSNSGGLKELKKDKTGAIWAVSKNGLLAKLKSNDQFEVLNTMFPNQKEDIKVQLMFSEKEKIWFTDKKGTVFTYSYKKNTLDSITSIPNIEVNKEEIQDLLVTGSNKLLTSTNKGNIYSYSLQTNHLEELQGPFKKYPGSIIMTLDKDDNLWIGTETLGLFCYNLKNKKFIQDNYFKGKHQNITRDMFISLYCDSKGNIWGGTDGGGLYKVNTQNGNIELFRHNLANKFSLSSNSIVNINEDRHNNLWILTNYGDVNILPFTNANIQYYKGSANNIPERVLSIFKSEDNVLWVGTDGNGLTKITENDNNSQYLSNKGFEKGFYIQSITEDTNNNIWLGTYKNGLWIHNPKNEKFTRLRIINSKGHEATDVRFLFRDRKNRIWVGSNISLNVYSDTQTLLASYENNTHGLSGEIAESIIEDEKGTLWFGYFKGGLFELHENENLQDSRFQRHPYANEHPEKKENYGIISMASDSNGTIWIVNTTGYLSKFNIFNKSYQSLRYEGPLNTNSFRSVLIKNKDSILLSSHNDLWHLELEAGKVKKLYQIDGVQINIFLPRSAHKDNNGYFYFGGTNGLHSFLPHKMRKKEVFAKLNINSIEILNQPANSLIPDQLSNGMENVKNINLAHNQSSFSFRFSAIENTLNSNFHYAYRLKGFKDDWIVSRQERIATYTNIPPGNYTFEVKAGTKKGVWNIPPKEIKIYIAQPLWNQTWAHLIYLIIGILIVYAISRWIQLKNKLTAEEWKYIQEKELYALKMNFFIKMSHEIQTPITLILGPIDDMITRAERNGNLLLKQRLNIISNNVKRLSKIATELTIVRNKELGKLRLRTTKNNLVDDLNNITLAFKEQARFKHIDFTTNYPNNLADVWYDKDKIEHILYNLLSNAFKFTPKEGNIQLNAVPVDSKKFIKISVSDSGPGIPKDELENIFTLFYQSNVGKQNKGTGIGLALTKELIDLHHGQIEVKSSESEGTCFTITIPIQEDGYSLNEKIIREPSEETTIEEASLTDISSDKSEPQLKKDAKTILIVEDNFELQIFLKDIFSPNYNVIIAENGEEGLSFTESYHPDIILSDVMMPKMDGIEMCKILQKNKVTAHIPIVLMTAKNTTNSKISGLKSGAIEYISKPFNTNELILKVNNILASKEKIISKYKEQVISVPKVDIKKSQDEIFLENLVSNIELRIENNNFKLEELADSLNMSYSALYRKCQAITGKTLVDYVRLLRLKKAAIVISKYGYSISEAAFMVGFNDPKYFSKCFKKEFGKTPNTFKKEAQKTGVDEYLNNLNLGGNI